MNTRNQYPIFIHACGFNSALGESHHDIHKRLREQLSPDMVIVDNSLNDGRSTVVGQVSNALPVLPDHLSHFDSRNNRLALSSIQQIEDEIRQAIRKYGRNRVAVIIGTSTSGISDGEKALDTLFDSGSFPTNYHYNKQELGNPAEFVAEYFDLEGPCYSISTACSSSGRVFLSAKRMLKANLVDAVIVGGVDSLCRLTLNGFRCLEALSTTLCKPFDKNRDGINIGEAAAFMLLSTEPTESNIALLGAGDSSDAHHISAPHPDGKGAIEAMTKALFDAQMDASEIGYVNAHGTATQLNDAMESKAIASVFDRVPVSSTKPLTGHTLGAASAVEAAISWHILTYTLPLPSQINNHGLDNLPIQLVKKDQYLPPAKAILSNSFAFGGNNISLIFGYANE
ncbi:beta-ketoacyl-[acyl-carrier-protein] synthase family protein [Vibrio sp. DW001]|uniref:beta-ketoacyl-[acyl-carrier-protein] synthase family protein n=1 Tax=Vibrio sp. DW001 TaxID=2912315 RepID=UPI0023B108AE|nr:beta-ketoacyl-[acyl-carrier-protein] synthase family protein [Vibrio sp. DW001]WED25961.1 beta-ketoacyl-[acyl-carrier-protein] synthase family protein [Vibrio sp. DW001]